MKVYISGGISGLHDGNRLAFAMAEKHWMERGHAAINPHVLCAHLPDPKVWEDCMRECLVALQLCDAIWMLKGWELSKGACMEHEKALQLGLKVMYE